MYKRHRITAKEFSGEFSVRHLMAASCDGTSSKHLFVEVKFGESGGVRSVNFQVMQDNVQVYETGGLDLAIERYNELP